MISKKLIKAKGEDTKQWISLSKWTEKTEDDDPDNDPTSPKAKQVQSGFIYHYAFAILIGLSIIITFIIFRF